MKYLKMEKIVYRLFLKSQADIKYIKSLIKAGLNYEPSILLSVLNEQYFKFL